MPFRVCSLEGPSVDTLVGVEADAEELPVAGGDLVRIHGCPGNPVPGHHLSHLLDLKDHKTISMRSKLPLPGSPAESHATFPAH